MSAAEGTVIEVRGLSKSFGDIRAVSDLSFTVRPGVVTGFLGPNGAGKTTTMRAMLGLISPDEGRVTFGGSTYASLRRPSSVVGAVLDSANTHPGCSARDHLRIYAAMAGYSASRIETVMDQTGVTGFADRRTAGFSTGMRQRLSLATALLGDPEVLMLDEPSNGLDPEGIVWLRGFLRSLATEGRTVLVSSHVLGEVQQTVDDVLLVNAGHLLWAGALTDLGEPGDSLENAYLHLTSATAQGGTSW
jgi:ABC-2 type transport system ATP-binding protein